MLNANSLALNLAMLATMASPALADTRETESWLKWKRTYSASSPITARNKTISPYWRIPDATYTSVIQGEAPPPNQERRTTYMGKELGIDLEASHIRAGSAPIEEDPRYPGRDGQFRKRLLGFCHNQDPRRLVVVIAGFFHILDAFYESPKSDVVYASAPFDENSETGNADLWRFFETMEMARRVKHGLALNENRVQKIGLDSSFGPVFLPLMFVGGFQRKGRGITSDELLSNRGTHSHTLFIADFHGLADADMIRDLPTAADWKEMEVESVEFVLEARELVFREKGYTPEEVKKSISHWLYPKEHYMALAEKQFSANRFQDLQAQTKDLQPIASPLYDAVLARSLEYRRDGFPVSFQGLE